MISIIIPVYNHSSTLPKVLDSIADQTVQDLEVIVVDDGSQDPVRVDAQKYSFPLQLIRQKNAGAPVARNNGFKKSGGEYVIFWDADIIAHETMLEKMKTVLDCQKDVSFVYVNFHYGKTLMKGKKFNIQELKKNNYIPVCSLIRRKDFPGFDPKLKRFQDWDVWLTMVEEGNRGYWINDIVFRTVQEERIGISDALPSYAYTFPFRYLPPWKKSVQKYFLAKKVVQKKHGI